VSSVAIVSAVWFTSTSWRRDQVSAPYTVDRRLLPGRGLRLARARRKHAGDDATMHRDERVALEHAHVLAEQWIRSGVFAHDLEFAINTWGPNAFQRARRLRRCSGRATMEMSTCTSFVEVSSSPEGG
jgi:hypothetical protein